MQNQLIELLEVDQIISQVALKTEVITVSLSEAIGKVLAETIHADRDFPPFNRVAMDGIAINYNAIEKGKHQFKIEGIQAAGSPQMTLQDTENCLEVMTGAMLPENADVVIPYEWTRKEGDAMIVEDFNNIQSFGNIHKQGNDQEKGDLLLESGTPITSAEIGLLATVGKYEVKVYAKPKVAIIATGDELVNIEDTPAPHQIRMSNCFTIQSRLQEEGLDSKIFHLKDDYERLKQAIQSLFEEYDIFVFSGGVSKGKFDYLPKVFEELGVSKKFHGVKQRPGKPFWFGVTAKNQPIFALPGNPVSTYLCTNRYLMPWLYKQECISAPLVQKYATLSDEFTFKKPLSFFLQVKAYYDEEGKLWAQPVKGGGSGDMTSLLQANAFLELPGEKSDFSKDEKLPIWFYKK
ncbi:molybdopterin molybdotransferase MoeA [Flammeovirga sp. EKP202]|uniref:molybdopterin molybdotransferase MoeA n=1 Tax=Flammeovirga sp. EKP202 TaxID=2770592 RepID=UPI00165FF55B|nr:molybdopterin molybdotransferase MoeA [Flammeovirga sp. EKP202]MBD0403591.1 molybdopterin molybdotransferase MoeA [Flammeovirga sp. EKP202]